MSTALQVFSFKGENVRVVVEDKEWFVGKDVCKRLGLVGDINSNLSKINNLHKGPKRIGTPGGFQNMLCVDEAGLYELITCSNKPEAREFKEWVFNDVLPTIRKTGSYSIRDKQVTTLQELMAVSDDRRVLGGTIVGIGVNMEETHARLVKIESTLGRVEKQLVSRQTSWEFRKRRSINLDKDQTAKLGKLGMRICAQEGYDVEFKTVGKSGWAVANLPKHVWELAYQEFMGSQSTT